MAPIAQRQATVCLRCPRSSFPMETRTAQSMIIVNGQSHTMPAAIGSVDLTTTTLPVSTTALDLRLAWRTRQSAQSCAASLTITTAAVDQVQGRAQALRHQAHHHLQCHLHLVAAITRILAVPLAKCAAQVLALLMIASPRASGMEPNTSALGSAVNALLGNNILLHLYR